MLFEYPCVLGFAMPMMVPLASLSFLVHSAAFQWYKSRLDLDFSGRPSTSYLWVSLVAGWALQVWLYYESELQALWLMLLGPPCVGVCCKVLARCPKFRHWSMEHATKHIVMQEDLDALGVAFALDEPFLLSAEEQEYDAPNSDTYTPPTALLVGQDKTPDSRDSEEQKSYVCYGECVECADDVAIDKEVEEVLDKSRSASYDGADTYSL